MRLEEAEGECVRYAREAGKLLEKVEQPGGKTLLTGESARAASAEGASAAAPAPDVKVRPMVRPSDLAALSKRLEAVEGDIVGLKATVAHLEDLVERGEGQRHQPAPSDNLLGTGSSVQRAQDQTAQSDAMGQVERDLEDVCLDIARLAKQIDHPVRSPQVWPASAAAATAGGVGTAPAAQEGGIQERQKETGKPAEGGHGGALESKTDIIYCVCHGPAYGEQFGGGEGGMGQGEGKHVGVISFMPACPALWCVPTLLLLSSAGEMIACDNPQCEMQWFHLGCVGLSEAPKGAWYCDQCKKNMSAGRGKPK